ncbi:response regulator transcription factor [Paenibacillus sp. KQZ6P-2]|uniref:Response regulator transcription factor n=1 Tax=Paenibacillus mangrovi TaxID=2931978 RepID=A0A9X1WX05_9BACL|nr:response regulator transcription factor [Paenibacillus mangrovi]MCJ8013579.1 response regulator transcription factor [Paenibacillus mangrovi]
MSELCKVLIVDDELLVRQGIKHYINWEKEGFQLVGEASNGQDALQLVEQLHPHIIITDVVMPVMDGQELTRRVKLQYPEIEVIVLSSFSEFDYVKSTFQHGVVDYILKPKLESEELLRVLQKTAALIPTLQLKPNELDHQLSIDHVLTKAITGYDLESEDSESSLLADVLPYRQFALLGIQLKPGQAKPNCKGLEDKLRTALEANIQQEQMNLYTVYPEPHIAIFIINQNHVHLHEISCMASEAVKGFMNQDLRMCWALSDVFEGANNLATVYQEQIIKLFQYQYYFPERLIMVNNELPNAEAVDLKFQLNGLTEDLKRGRYQEAFQDLLEHAQRMSRNYRTDIYEFKSFLSNMIFNITIIMSNMGMDITELDEAKYRYFKAIDEALYAVQTIELLQTFLNEAASFFESQDQHSNQNMKRLLDYVQKHYAEALTLSEMAKHFHFNPSYLSSYFAANNKEGFNEYLNRVRIEKAAELLRDKAASISEISGMVGFSDHSYFCKVFKKFTGLSPSQYRRNHNN